MVLCRSRGLQTDNVAKDDLELPILLLLPPKQALGLQANLPRPPFKHLILNHKLLDGLEEVFKIN